MPTQFTQNRAYQYPGLNDDAWYNVFVAMVTAIDADINTLFNAITAPGSKAFLITYKDTLANIKATVQANPTVQAWAWATDVGGTGQLYFYCANTALGDQGFLPIMGGG